MTVNGQEWRVTANGQVTVNHHPTFSILDDENFLALDSSDDCTGFWICQKPEINTLSRVCYMV